MSFQRRLGEPKTSGNNVETQCRCTAAICPFLLCTVLCQERKKCAHFERLC